MSRHIVALVRLAAASFVLLAGSFTAAAQTAGLTCHDCGSSGPYHTCKVDELYPQGSGCFLGPNCQTPQINSKFIEVVPIGSGIYEARLVVDVTAFRNTESATNFWLKMFWSTGSTANIPSSSLCEHSTSDRVYTYRRAGNLTCAGAPYDLGTYSMGAVVCQFGGSSCERSAKAEAMPFVVTPQMLDCPIPRTDDCDSCPACQWVGPGGGSRGGKGSTAGGPGTGPKALLWYASKGGAGEPGLPGSTDWNVTLGRYWSHSYAQRIVEDPDDSHVWLITDHATFREFENPDPGSGLYERIKPSDEYRELYRNAALDGWELRAPDGTVWAFDTDGFWTSTTDRNGNEILGVYDLVEPRLEHVEFPDTRQEQFAYYAPGEAAEGKLESITELGVDGVTTRTWTYTWSGDDLTRIDRPDGTAWVMSYSTEPALPGFLTAIRLRPVGGTGSTDRVLVAWDYDSRGNVTHLWRGAATYADTQAVDTWVFSYDDPVDPAETTVTDPLGAVSTYTLERDPNGDKPRVTQIEGDCPTCSVGPNSVLTYGDPAHPLLPTAQMDGRGTVNAFTYSASGKILTREEAESTGLARTTTWTYDADYPGLVETIAQQSVDGTELADGGGRVTTITRDASGNETSREISGVEGGSWDAVSEQVTGASPFAFTTETDPNGAGLPLYVDPDDDGTYGTADRTVYTYDSTRGDLVPLTRTDPVVGTTTFVHDAFNRRTEVTDPAGLTTVTTYDALDRVTSVTQEGPTPAENLTTSYEHDDYGDLFRITLPAGNQIEYDYEDATGRLIEVARWNAAETAGERVTYLYDKAGNRMHEEHSVWDESVPGWASPATTTDYYYASRCQLDRTVQAPGTTEEAVTEYDYDCNGNLEKVWDAEHDSTSKTATPSATYFYDELNRLTSVSHPWDGPGGGTSTTTYGYDVQDHLVSVEDAESSTTLYTYSDRDLLVREDSPVSGPTTHLYNRHGELTATTDARLTTESRELDAFDRVTALDYVDDSLDTDFVYDDPLVANSAGRLTAITRDGHTVSYEYDPFGRVTRDGDLTYEYDLNGNRTVVGYPGGVEATYGYDFADRQITLSVITPSVPTPATAVVTDAAYLPSGPLSSLAFGNGVSETRGFDGRYQPETIALSAPRNRSWTYSKDGVGNILEIISTGDCAGDTVLTSHDVTGTEDYESCAALEAGPDVTVTPTGALDLAAASRVVLRGGVSVEAGGTLAVRIDPALSGNVTKTYGYQDYDYFLTSADGPWGSQSWNYDKIGNRTSETDNGWTDDYSYTANGAGGNTALLSSISLALGNSRDFDYTPAGHQTEVSANGNTVTFDYDDAGRLQQASRTGGATCPFVYDGRGFLQQAGDLATTGTVVPTYDSSGLLYALLKQPSATEPERRYHVFYLAGRPVAQLATETGQSDRWWYLTTDHLGTPLVATDSSGVELWENRFEPFGEDPTGQALADEIFLRFPGQWEDGVWTDATLGARVSYNLYRWFQHGLGRYSSVDPLVADRDSVLVHSGSLDPPYLYAMANPLRRSDPLGLCSLSTLYSELRRRRVEGHNRFPGPPNSFRRHCTISCESAVACGPALIFLIRLAGWGNEIQGLVLHDLPNLGSRLEGRTPWAFQLDDFFDNEEGFLCSSRVRRGPQCNTCEQCCGAYLDLPNRVRELPPRELPRILQ